MQVKLVVDSRTHKYNIAHRFDIQFLSLVFLMDAAAIVVIAMVVVVVVVVVVVFGLLKR